LKLFRFGPKGRERPGIIDRTGKGHDISSIVEDFDALALGPALQDRLTAISDLTGLPEVDLTTERLAAPFRRPGTIYCIGLNYVDHAREAGMPIPDEPVVFSKAASSLSGPNDPILWSADMSKLDWEVELGVVIGQPAFRVTQERALDTVFGFTVVNDVSERASPAMGRLDRKMDSSFLSSIGRLARAATRAQRRHSPP
jgi:2-keto-4-pentenoate hydratase/2-oxohepta-3-ene-1,7-dioic acid hydratase in catechol pathway